jgi:anti-sigma factor RsiW
MNRCKQVCAQTAFYLDDELQGSERAALESHLKNCRDCSEIFEIERRFLETIRGCRPLHEAGPEIRARVERVMKNALPAHTAPPALRHRVRKSLWRFSSKTSRLLNTRTSMAVIAIIGLALIVGLWGLNIYKRQLRPKPPSDFALMAVDTHQRHQRGQLPLEIASDAPEQISAWFAGKVPFRLALPNYQELSGQEKLYELEGARLVGYKNDYAAYVAYQMQMRPISLLVTSDAVAHPSGGEEIVSKGIEFHYDSIGGLKVISWSDRGLTYALVSDLEERGQQSCIVCHQGTKDQDFIESLKPK